MERRTHVFYSMQPCIIKYSLRTPGGNTAPENIAVCLAILNRKNVVLKPTCKVSLHGQVGVPPRSDVNVDWYDFTDTPYIQSIYFERVRENGRTTYHCYIKVSEDTTYLLWDSDYARLKEMKELVDYIEERDLRFEDFADYFSDINQKCEDVEIVPTTEIQV